MNNLYRKVYKLMPGTANDLLALPNELGGLNCAPICDKLFNLSGPPFSGIFSLVVKRRLQLGT